MKIETHEEPLTWRDTEYQIDNVNQLAFAPHHIRAARESYKKLMRRGKISTRFIKDAPPERKGIFSRFAEWMVYGIGG